MRAEVEKKRRSQKDPTKNRMQKSIGKSISKSIKQVDESASKTENGDKVFRMWMPLECLERSSQIESPNRRKSHSTNVGDNRVSDINLAANTSFLVLTGDIDPART